MLPFARFPGADPVLGPEMRSTGEVMASAADLPTAFAKAERAAGRPLPADGRSSSRCATRTRPQPSRSRRRFAGLGFHLVATDGTARTLRAAGLDVDDVRKVNEPGDGPTRRRSDPPRALQPRGQHAGRRAGAALDGYLIREAALVARVPCITTIAAATAAVHAIANARAETALSLQERIDVETAARAS